jgi:outer membrane lipoprotein-sorting protein
MSLLLGAIAAASVAAAPQSINSYITSGFRDAAFTTKVQSSNSRELQKINRDFAQSYRFKQMSVQMKEPFMLRLESKVEDTAIVFVLNGGRKTYKLGPVKTSVDVARAPGKRQTAFDFGFLTPALFDNFFNAKFVRTDRATGNAVFDLTYVPFLRDKSRHRVFIDPERKALAKREWYNQRGMLMATFTYDDYERVGGLWLPMRASVRNAENNLAGVVVYTNMRVNSGIADSVFKI